MRVHRETRAQDDGYRCTLVPGLRASPDVKRLVDEVGFASGRLLALSTAPPGLYGEAQAMDDLERATWTCFLIAYLSPLQGVDPFAGIRQALSADWRAVQAPDLAGVPLGPRTSHDPARGASTLIAYRRWVAHAGSQSDAFSGEAAWSPQRRFERLFERLALHGFSRAGRYELLVTLGRLGLYELRADSLQLTGSATRSGPSPSDPTVVGAKRVFGIGEPLYLERRALALAEALAVPVEALELALANWASPERITMGFAPDTRDAQATKHAQAVLQL